MAIADDGLGGHGVYAQRNITKSDISVYYRGHLFSSKGEHTRAFPTGSKYALEVRSGEVWDASNIMCIARFINHAAGKRANVHMCHTRDTNVVEIVLSRDITAGEQLFMSYGTNYNCEWPTPGTDTVSAPPKGAHDTTGRDSLWSQASIEQWISLVGIGGDEHPTPIVGHTQGTHSRQPTISHTCHARVSVVSTVREASEGSTSAMVDAVEPDAVDLALGQPSSTPNKPRGKQIPAHGLRASDGLVYSDGDYKSDWSAWDLENGPHRHLAWLQTGDRALNDNAMARDTSDSPRILPDQTNEAPWIKAAASASWAWGSNIVPIGFVPNEGKFAHQQIFLDTLSKPLSVYHWRTRSGRAGVNRRIMGSYVVTELDLHGTIIERGNTPLLQMDHKFGLRLAGNVIEIEWQGPHTLSWRNISTKWAGPTMANGEITMDPEGRGGTGVVWSGRDSDPVVQWRLDRARVVGGPGGMPTFSPKRKLAAGPGAGKLLAFPTGNREDYVPMPPARKRQRHRTRAVFKDWTEVFRGDRYDRVTKWLRRHSIHLRACEAYCKKHDTKFIPDDAYATIAKDHRLPAILIMNDSDLVDRCKGMRLLRMEDGHIKQMFDDDPPLRPGAVKPAMVEKEERENTPWANKKMFRDLHEGFLAPLAHERGNTLVLRPYSKALYQCAAIWKEERDKGSDPEAMCHMFTPQSQHLAALPMIISNRSHVAKENGKWRQILNMSLNVIEGIRKVAPSLNARLRAARELEDPIPNLEMTKGTDISTCVGTYEAFGCKVKVYTWDASQYFHNFALGFLQSCEQGILGVDGNAMSVVLDMGREDSPRLTAQTSSFITESVSKAAHAKILAEVDLPPEAQEMTTVRGNYYGHASRQARLATGYMFVDDISLVTIDHPEVDRIVKSIVPLKTKPMGLEFTEEKYSDKRKGSTVFIGQRYHIPSKRRKRQGDFSSQHIKESKLQKYIESWSEIKELTKMSNEIHDQLLGRLTYAATAYLELKDVAAIVNDCKHTTHRMPTGWFPFSNLARGAMEHAIGVLKRDRGLPMLPIFDIPMHDQISTITLRGDASLNEDNGYNGFGIWFLLPNKVGPPTNLCLFDEWSPEEQKLLGRNTPMAEALCLVLGTRACTSQAVRKFMQTWHEKCLQLTDSESCSMKFDSLRAGSVCLDAARAEWQRLQEVPDNGVLPSWVQHTHREMNTGSDLLSKARWDLFRATLLAAGLGDATRIFLSDKDRDVKDLLMAKRSF